MKSPKIILSCLAVITTSAFADENQTLELTNTQPTQTMNTTTINEDSNYLVVKTPDPVPENVNMKQEQKDFASAWGLSAQVGTLGIGLNLSHALYDDYLDIRGQYNYLSYNTNFDNNQYNLKFNTIGLLLDYKPFAGAFRFTGGMYLDGRKFETSGNNIDLGEGMTASGNAGLSYPSVSPYLGIGIGSQAATSVDKKGFLINFDAGVMFAKATAYTNLTCNGSSSDCQNFNSQVQDLQDNLNSGFKAFPFYPVLSLSLGYRF